MPVTRPLHDRYTTVACPLHARYTTAGAEDAINALLAVVVYVLLTDLLFLPRISQAKR